MPETHASTEACRRFAGPCSQPCTSLSLLPTAGWFHSEQAPDGAELATRSQLQLRAGQDTAADFRPFTGGAPSGALGPEDLSQLARFVNPSYLEESNWGRVAARFQDDGSVQLQNFLAPAWAAQLAAAAAAADASDKLGRGQVPAYTAGMRGGWQAVGPTHKQRYLRYAPEAAAAGSGGAAAAADGEDDGTAKAMGALLAKLQEELFSTAAFARLLTEASAWEGRGCGFTAGGGSRALVLLAQAPSATPAPRS